MKKNIKKITSLVIAFVIIFTSAVAFNIPKMVASAGGTHVHKACIGLTHEGCTHEDIEFEPYPGDTGMIIRGKNYYLTKDIVLGENDRIFVEKGVSTLCLNGHSITKDNGQIIDINNIDGQKAELNICDCTGTGTIKNISLSNSYACINVIDDSTLNMYSGTIDGGIGSGIHAEVSEGDWTGSGGSVNIYGGRILSDDNACIYLSHVTGCGCWDDEKAPCTYPHYTNSLSVYGGELRSSGYFTINVLGKGNKVSICGGKIIGSADLYDTLKIKCEDADVSISGGEVISEKYDAVYMLQGTLKISGGIINSTSNAIFNSEDCEICIDGGVINGGTKINSNSKNDSAIRNYGTLKISNGTINGTGIYAIKNHKDAVFEISGGTIDTSQYALYNMSDGLADIKGGSLTTTGYYSVWNNGTLNISGGEIKASNSPAINHGTLNISGGSFGTEASPTYIINNKLLNLSGSPVFNNTGIWLQSDDNIGIAGELTYSAPCPVYIDSTTPRVLTSGWSSYMGTGTPSDYFKSPYSTCIVAKSNGEVLLRRIMLTFDANGGTCDTSNASVNDDLKASDLPEAEREGFSFDGWFTARDGGDKITTDTVFNSDTTLYAHWTVHVHNWQDTEIIKAPSCTEGGKTLQTCTSCGKTQTINTDSLGGHSFSDTWEYNENNHWKVCETCNAESSKETHTWNEGDVITPPTGNKEGKTRYTCTVCGAVKEESIPATGEDDTNKPTIPDKGNIIKDISLSDNVPKTTLATPLSELITSVLTTKEQEIINSGINIKIILTVNDATDNVSALDKTTVESKLVELKDYKLGQYLDINLLKIIGDSEGIKITQTNSPITVTFEIPDGLKGKVRYSVIRIHDGKVDVLYDLDSSPDTITIETDKFSTYALAYQDEAPTDNTSDSTSDNTSDSTSDNASDSTSDNTSDNISGTNSTENESTHAPGDSSTPNISDNPSTGAAVSLIPLVSIVSGIIVVINRKKK